MTDKTREFRVTITGPEKSVEQLYHELAKLEGEASRSGVDVTVERIHTSGSDMDFDLDFE